MPDTGSSAPVLVVGGGAAGLAAAASLAMRGIVATVLERETRIGMSWERRYDALRLHTARRFSGLPGYSIPRNRPRYLSKDEYAAYLREYAAALALDVETGSTVERIRVVPESDAATRLEVITSTATLRAAAVVIATGHYAVPWMPDWEGKSAFEGTLIHSSEFDTGARYSGRRAVVIGLGNSGAEIASDLCENGASPVTLSTRSSPPIVPRDLLGVVPVQLLGITLTPLPVPGLVDRVGAAFRRVSIGDLRRHGVGRAEWGPFTARRPAVIDSKGFVDHLKRGRVVVRPETVAFTGSEVVYADGSRDVADVVVAATGFRTGLGSHLDIPGLIDETGQPRFRSGRPTPVLGVYFIGYDETVRGHLFEAAREAPRLARTIDEYLARL